MKMIEIERKYHLNDDQVSKIKDFFKNCGLKVRPIHQVDVVYLCGIESFKDLKPGMPVVRIRTTDTESKLTYKKTINKAGDSIEHEVAIDNPAAMTEILHAENYREVTTVIKDRIELSIDSLTYALDRVENLGWFLEIEILADNESILEKAEHTIKIAAANLSLFDEALEPEKYDKLLANL